MTREQWLAGQPELTRDNELVKSVWRFCGGWNPQALPLAAAYYGIDDMDMLIEQLLLLRDTIGAHQAALREAGHGG